MIKRPTWDHESSSAEPERKQNFGSAPRVGQSKPYVSGGQAHGKHEKPRGNVAGAGHVPLGGPFKKS